MKTLTLGTVRQERLSNAHSDYLANAIRRYREKAARAVDLARAARNRGNTPLALGLLDEAETFRAMAEGLIQQSQTDAQETHS